MPKSAELVPRQAALAVSFDADGFKSGADGVLAPRGQCCGQVVGNLQRYLHGSPCYYYSQRWRSARLHSLIEIRQLSPSQCGSYRSLNFQPTFGGKFSGAVCQG